MNIHKRTLFSLRARLGLTLLMAAAAMGVLLVVTALAAPGDLDPAFDGDGKTTTVVGPDADYARGVAIQPDGKIVVVGDTRNASSEYDFALTRYNADGSLDNTFGASGIVTTDFGARYESLYAAAVLSNGKILAAGYVGSLSNTDFALARYNTDGSLDDTFGASGIVTTDVGSGSGDTARDMVLQPDGKIVLAGLAQVGNGDFAVVRYNADGSLDAGFGTGGYTTTDVIRYDYGSSVALQPDGKIVVAGKAGTGSPVNYDFAVVRYNADGSLDGSFGTGGYTTTAFGSGNDNAYGVALQSDGKIVVAGEALKSGSNDFALARYDTDGSLDAGFGTDGLVTTDIWSGDGANAVLIQADGKIVALGDSLGNNQDFTVVRYNTDGSLDTSFGSGGIVKTDFDFRYDAILAAALQEDGKLVAAGIHDDSVSDYDFAVARYDTRVTGTTTVGTGETPIGGTGISATLDSGSCTVYVTKTIAFPGGVSDKEPGEMPMYWEITTDCAPDTYSMTLKFCYTADELANGDNVSAANLAAFRYVGAEMWSDQGGMVDGNCVVTYGVSSLSYWTLGDSISSGNSDPNAVAMRGVGVGSGALIVPVVAVVAAGAAGIVGLAVTRRRRTG